MAEILTKTYTYTGQSDWIYDISLVPLSDFKKSDKRPITQIISISASWYRYYVNTTADVIHTAELVFSNGTTLKSNRVTKRGNGKIFKIDVSFVDIPDAADWVESNIKLRTTQNHKLDRVQWCATSTYPMVLTITYLSSEFKPSITDAKLYRANSLGAAADDGTNLSFKATLAVEKTGKDGSGSGTFKIYSGDSASTTTTQVYSRSVSGSTSGVTISDGPTSEFTTTVDSGVKKWFRMEFAYTATTESGVSSTETASATFLITNVFTNVHLAGKKKGGVAFGKYSASTDDIPMFECNYPAYFYGGIAQIGNGSGDLLALLGIEHGYVESMTMTGSKTNEKEVTFPRAFATPPDVVCTFDSTNISEFKGRWDYLTLTVSTVTATGFKIRVHNGTDTLSPSPGIRWIAVGTPKS